MRTLTAKFSTLSRDLKPHANGSRWPRIKSTSRSRDEAKIVGKAVGQETFGFYQLPLFKKVRVSLTLYADTKLAKDRQCYVPRDRQNLIAAVKPHIDGLKDAGWVTDDDKSCIVGFDPVNIITGKEAGGKCELVITFTEVE